MRRQLVLFALALGLPILAFLALVLWELSESERTRIEGDALSAARNLAAVIDRDLRATVSAAKVLALSPHLANDDLRSFREQAAIISREEGLNTVLRDAQGRQLVNARVPLGGTLPDSPDPADAQVLATGAPAVTDLLPGNVSGGAIYAIIAAAVSGLGEPRLLSVSRSVDHLRQILIEANLPPQWTIAVVDRQGVILARNNRHEDYVGQSATEDLRANTSGMSGTWNGFTIEGQPIFGAYARVPFPDWRVAIGVSTDDLNAPWRRSVQLLLMLGLATLALSFGLAMFFGWRIAMPVRALAERARALGAGAPVQRFVSPIGELNEVGDALVEASSTLQDRRKELERHASEREVVAHELNHRIKNVFAVIAGIIALSARTHPEMKGLANELRQRITALARAHDFVNPKGVSVGGQTAPVTLKGLIAQLLDPYALAGKPSFALSGDEVAVDDRSATPLALLFHELATNAVKYGALSRDGGRVEISVRQTRQQVTVIWKERGGPELTGAAQPSGFGTRLTALAVESQLGGQVERLWEADGLRCHIAIPLSAFTRVK